MGAETAVLSCALGPMIIGVAGRFESRAGPLDYSGLNMSGAKKTTSTVVPSLLYHDAPAAIEWLCRAFGFEKRLVVPGSDGTIAHAQLVFGNGMIMLCSAESFEFGDILRSPRDVGGVGTCEPCVCVVDADAHQGAGDRGRGGSREPTRGQTLRRTWI